MGTQALLRLRTLYVFGQVATVKRWKQSPPKHTPSTPTPGLNTPLGEESQPPQPAPHPLFVLDPKQSLKQHIRGGKGRGKRREGPSAT